MLLKINRQEFKDRRKEERRKEAKKKERKNLKFPYVIIGSRKSMLVLNMFTQDLIDDIQIDFLKFLKCNKKQKQKMKIQCEY